MIRALPQMSSPRRAAMQMTFTVRARVSPGIHFHKDTLWRSDERSFAPKKKNVSVKWRSCFYPAATTFHGTKCQCRHLSGAVCDHVKLLAARQGACVIARLCEVTGNENKHGSKSSTG